MNSNLNILSVNSMKDRQLEQILENTLKTNPGNDLKHAVFKDVAEYDSMRFTGAVNNVHIALDDYYDEHRKHLKNIRTVIEYLESDFAGNSELEEALKDAKKQSELWIAIYVQPVVHKAIDEMRKSDISFFTSPKFHAFMQDMDRLKRDIYEYPWTKEDFIYFMDASLDAYAGHLDSIQMLLVHMVQHGPGFMIQKMEKEKYEKEIASITKKSDALQVKNERKIAKLTEDTKKQKEQMQSLQNKLSKKDRSSVLVKQAEQKQEKIKKESEKQLSVLDAGFNLERKELLREIELLKEKNNALNKQLEHYQELLQEDKQTELPKDALDLTKYNVIFMGGHPNLINKLREKYSAWTYFNDESISETLPNDADFLVYFTSRCSHTVFYRMQSWNKTRKRLIHYAYSNNIEQLEQSIQEFIYQEDSIPIHKDSSSL